LPREYEFVAGLTVRQAKPAPMIRYGERETVDRSSIIEVTNVSKTYSSTRNRIPIKVLDDLSFNLEAGAFLSIIGPSGCGKSTLLHIIGGLKCPSSGVVYIKQRQIEKPVPDLVAMVFQEPTLLPWRSVLDNVCLGLEIRGDDKRRRTDKARHYIELVGLTDFVDRYPSELSGGMRQRVLLARALAQETEVLLMDEPFGALDEQTRLLLCDELLNILKKAQRTIVLVTHSLFEAAYFSDVILVMTTRPGRIKKAFDVRHSGLIASRSRGQIEELREALWIELRDESVKAMGRR
jgi:NitT/TauT family transport system ATP-binding protein